MKKLGTSQFEQKTFKTIKLSGDWLRFLGSLMYGFKILVYGKSGNGKTEIILQLLRILVKVGKVEYISYEQGHGMDLQMAMKRNKDDDWNGGVIWCDPWEGLPEEFSTPLMIPGKKGKLEKASPQFQDLVHNIAKKKSADFWFIDSIQDSLITWYEYKYLVNRFKRKSFVLISLAEGAEPKGSEAKAIKANMHIAIQVKDYIAFNNKNRMGGTGEWVIWREEAMKRNPLYFEMKAKEERKASRKSKAVVRQALP